MDFLNDKNNFEWALSDLINLNFKNLILPNSLVIPYFTAQKLKEERLMILANFKEFITNFNTFEVDSIISQIPNIRNLSISRSITKNENELKKLIVNPKDILNNNNSNCIINGNINGINLTNLDNNNYINSSPSPAFCNSNSIVNSYNNNFNSYQNNNLLDFGVEGINSKISNSSQQKILNNDNIFSSLDKNTTSNINNTLITFNQNNRDQLNPNSFENNHININNLQESFYEACSEMGAVPAENNLISSNGEIIFNSGNYQLSNKSITQNKYFNSSIDRKFYNDITNQINPKSIITNGKPISIGERLEQYYRNPEGGVECRNHEELRSQDGIILELMKRAGKQLLEGKNIVGVSLPVKIFEPRSTLTRLTELWGTAYEYFNKTSESFNPIERIKMIITMAMSGLHLNARQTKPFNPILGETYEVNFYNLFNFLYFFIKIT